MRNKITRWFKWIYATRLLGAGGFVWLVGVQRNDKPYLTILCGVMMLGAESFRNILGGGRD